MAGGGGNDDVQCYVAIDMMNRLLDDKTPGKDERKALITGFSRLYIPDTTPLEQLKELFELVDEYVNEGDISEAYAKNAMQRFYNEIKGAIERAEQLLAVKPDEKEEEELVLIHSASENPKEDKEKDSKEVFETPSEEPTEKVVTEDGTGPDRLSLVESVAEVEAKEDNDIENAVANGDLEDNEEAKLEKPEAETSESENEDISIQDNKNETYEDQDEKEDDDDDDELIPQVNKTSRSSRTTRSSRSTFRFSSRTKAEATDEDSKDRTTPNSKTSKDKFLLKRKSVSKSNDKSKSRSSKSSKTSKNAKYERPGKRQRTSGTKQDVSIEIDDSVGDSN
ncbi:hypothetical protein D0Z03_000310 [Geotrichum reessii]|nr:hypothetical protein D0Z03_000310 [Galactomyces reessii]